MHEILFAASLIAGAATPMPTNIAVYDDASQENQQSVFREEKTIFVRNWDGSSSETTIITVYYLFGVE